MYLGAKILKCLKQKEINNLLNSLIEEYNRLWSIFLGAEVYEDKSCINSIINICNRLERYENKGIQVIDYPFLSNLEMKIFCDNVLELKNQAIKLANNIDERNIRIKMYQRASDLEKSYKFEEALEEYRKIHQMYPNQIRPILSIAELYKKLNKLEKAIAFLHRMKEKKYYENDISYRHNLDKKLLDLEEKYKRGYVYRPRKKSAQ